MSKSGNKDLNIKRRSLSGKEKSVSLKDSKAASIRHVRSKNAEGSDSVAADRKPVLKEEKKEAAQQSKKKAGKITFINTEDIEEAPAAGVKSDAPAKESAPKVVSKEEGPDLIWSSADDFLSQRPSGKTRWALIIPAIVVVLCMAMFVVASQAGWIQSFLTPDEKLVKQTSSEEPSTQPETTTKAQPTTKETTTEETTTEFIPSYYVVDVNLAYNVVTVYTRGEKLNDGWDAADPLDDEYVLNPVIAFTCSPGVNGATPTGRFYLKERAGWCFMVGDVYTQYATRIIDDVMFHSVPYFEQDPSTLETDQYNILGYEASSACIRLNVRDAAWIFNYCAEGTEVNIFYNWEYYGPLDPEPIYQIPTDIPQLAGWDPTDVYSAGNPWFTYSAFLTNGSVSVPCNSSVESLVAAIGPTDPYGNNLSAHFYTDGGYSLWYPGTYTTTGYIQVGNLSFSFPVAITVTEEIADEYYEGYEDYEDGENYDGSEESEDGLEDHNGEDTWDDSENHPEDSWEWGDGAEASYDEAEPYYEEPYYEEPAYEEPVQEEQVYEEPAYEEPVYEEPAIEDTQAWDSEEAGY